MMRVLRVIPNFYPMVTGPANQAFNISNLLESKNINSPILTSDFGLKVFKSKEKFENVTCYRFKSIINFYQYAITPGLIPFLLKTKFDLIHAHSYRNFQADLAYLMAKKKNRPFIINPHGSALGYSKLQNWQIYRTPYRLYDLFTFKNIITKANVVIASSKQELAELKQFNVDERKLIVIPSGVNILFPKRNLKQTNDGKIHLLFVGRITRDRRVELLLKAFSILLKKLKNVELWIVGSEERRSYTQKLGYMGELKALSKKLNIDQFVYFLGFLPKDKLREYYLKADIFIYTSDYENFGQTILEAASAGLPLICSPVGVASEIIEDGITGFIIHNSPKEIAERIEFLIDNEKIRSKMGQTIQKKVEHKYSWTNIIKKYIKLYETLLINQ